MGSESDVVADYWSHSNTTKCDDEYEEALETATKAKNKPMLAHVLTEMGQSASYNGDYQRGRDLLEEAKEVNRKMGDQGNVVQALRYLRWTARLQGDSSSACSLYSECLELSLQAQDHNNIPATLIHIGNLIFMRGSSEQFVLMLGAAEQALSKIRNILLPSFAIETEKFIETAKARLGDKAYTAAYRAGQQMSLNEAVTYALNQLQ